MKKIFVLRSARYNYLIGNHDLYDSFDLVAKGLVDPKLLADYKDDFLKVLRVNKISSDCVICADQRRSIQTGGMICKRVAVSNLLREVSYSMGEFIGRDNFYYKNGTPNIKAARQQLVKALVKDKLSESFSHILKRIDKIFQRANGLNCQSIVLISHGFIMKIFEIYVLHPEIKVNHSLFLKYYLGDTEAFKFCQGFVIYLKLNKPKVAEIK